MRAPSPFRPLGQINWQDTAACTGHHAVFEVDKPTHNEISDALSFCDRCPVVAECLEAALINDDRDSVRGGLSEKSRAPLHDATARRQDPMRVRAVLDGYDVHINKKETEVLVHTALALGAHPGQLGRLLKVSFKSAHDRLRYARKTERQDTDDERESGLAGARRVVPLSTEDREKQRRREQARNRRMARAAERRDGVAAVLRTAEQQPITLPMVELPDPEPQHERFEDQEPDFTRDAALAAESTELLHRPDRNDYADHLGAAA